MGLALRVRIRQLYGVWIPVRFDPARGLWILHWPDVVAPTLEPAPTSPQDFEEAHRDVFFQEYTPTAGDVIVDLGAGMGSELGFMTRVIGSTGRVFAVEADPLTYRCLAARVELNELENVTPIHAAVTDRSGEAFLSSVGHHLGHHLVEEGRGQRVPALTFDDLAERQGITRIDLLKVNIEGAENRAFAGMSRTIEQVRNVAVSCHDPDGRRPVRSFLSGHGFRVRDRTTSDLRPWARSWMYGTRT